MSLPRAVYHLSRTAEWVLGLLALLQTVIGIPVSSSSTTAKLHLMYDVFLERDQQHSDVGPTSIDLLY